MHANGLVVSARARVSARTSSFGQRAQSSGTEFDLMENIGRVFLCQRVNLSVGQAVLEFIYLAGHIVNRAFSSWIFGKK